MARGNFRRFGVALACAWWLAAAPARADGALAPPCAANINPSTVIVALDPQTNWRPMGGQLRLLINWPQDTAANSGTPPIYIQQLSTCFAWRLAGQPPALPDCRQPHSYKGIDVIALPPPASGGAEYAVTVPDMDPPDRQVAWSNLHTVPIADMAVNIMFSGGACDQITVPLPVGIPLKWLAYLAVAASMLLISWVLWCLVGDVPEPAPPVHYVPVAGKEGLQPVPITRCTHPTSWLFYRISSFLLRVIATENGFASLSQLQILIWTYTVFGAAAYVMVLSGTLVPLNTTMLELLGIAGGATVLVKAIPVPDGAKPPDRDATGSLVPGTGTRPEWAQLFRQNVKDNGVELTRVQMLVFTLLTASFVLVQVGATFSIPDIPPDMVALLGLSNGVYLAGRRAPSPPPEGGPQPAPQPGPVAGQGG